MAEIINLMSQVSWMVSYGCVAASLFLSGHRQTNVLLLAIVNALWALRT